MTQGKWKKKYKEKMDIAVLFILCKNNIVNLPCTTDIMSYADGTNVFSSDKTLEVMQNRTNAWLF